MTTTYRWRPARGTGTVATLLALVLAIAGCGG